MRKYLTLFLTFLTATLFAQGITTTAIKAQYLKNDSGKDILLFSEGDTVIIHAFKKKKDKYFFIIETEMFAKKVSSPSIPFSVEEKKLKKLPDALSKEMKDFLLQKKEEVALRMKKKYRRPALDGEFRALLKNYIAFTGGYIGFPNKGDSVTLLGYKKEENRQCYALYNDNCAGVYCSNDSPDYLFDTDIDVQYSPSVEDPEVLKALEKGEQMVKQNMADNKARFRKRALSGTLTGANLQQHVRYRVSK